MAINFCHILKNGSTFLRNVEKHLSSDADISIVCLREPYKRFWSTVKFFHPKFHQESCTDQEARQSIDDTIFFITKNDEKMSSYGKNFYYHSAPYQRMIEEHFRSQDSFIKDLKFDYVFKLENIFSELTALVDVGVLKIDKPIEQFKPMNPTRNIDDTSNMQYIIDNHSSVLRSLYANDFNYYENPILIKR